MALNSINNASSDEKKKSPLENAAMTLGVLSGLANAASTGYNSFVNEPQKIANQNLQTDLIKQKMSAPVGMKP